MSKKTNNKSIFLGLKIIAILVFAIAFSPIQAKAEVCIISSQNPCYRSVIIQAPIITLLSPNPVDKTSGPLALSVHGESFYPGAVVRFNGSNRATNYINGGSLAAQINSGEISNPGNYSITVVNPDGQISNVVYLAVNRELVTGSPSTTNPSGGNTSGTSSNTSNTGNTSGSNPDNYTSNLASNAIFGSKSFLPTGLMQWILLAIFILVIVILWRKMFVRDEKPLKHA